MEVASEGLPLAEMLHLKTREERLAYALLYAFRVNRLECLHAHEGPDDVCAGCVAKHALEMKPKVRSQPQGDAKP